MQRRGGDLDDRARSLETDVAPDRTRRDRVESVSMTTPLSLYESLVADALAGRPHPRRTTARFELSELGPPMLLAWGGFYPSRWVAFCDDYLDGGPAMDEWLRDPRRPLEFANGAGHRRDSCLTRLTHHRGLLTLESRACNLVPTGVLDLKMLQMAWRRLEAREAPWVVSDLQLARRG